MENKIKTEDQAPMQIKPIGYISSCYKDKFGTPRQPHLVAEAEGVIKLQPWVQPEISLLGLEEFSHIWVIFWFHKNNNSFHAKVHPPRLNGESRGVYATRSPHRPNPMGLSALKINRITESEIFVSGLDIVDGTPVLDIKPYLNKADSLQATEPAWVQQSQESETSIVWSEAASAELQKWQGISDEGKLKTLIEKTLRLDPRPLVYKSTENSMHRTQHAVRILDGDIHFQFLKPNQIQILNILF